MGEQQTSTTTPRGATVAASGCRVACTEHSERSLCRAIPRGRPTCCPNPNPPPPPHLRLIHPQKGEETRTIATGDSATASMRAMSGSHTWPGTRCTASWNWAGSTLRRDGRSWAEVDVTRRAVWRREASRERRGMVDVRRVERSGVEARGEKKRETSRTGSESNETADKVEFPLVGSREWIVVALGARHYEETRVDTAERRTVRGRRERVNPRQPGKCSTRMRGARPSPRTYRPVLVTGVLGLLFRRPRARSDQYTLGALRRGKK